VTRASAKSTLLEIINKVWIFAVWYFVPLAPTTLLRNMDIEWFKVMLPKIVNLTARSTASIEEIVTSLNVPMPRPTLLRSADTSHMSCRRSIMPLSTQMSCARCDTGMAKLSQMRALGLQMFYGSFSRPANSDRRQLLIYTVPGIVSDSEFGFTSEATVVSNVLLSISGLRARGGFESRLIRIGVGMTSVNIDPSTSSYN
jgi:hypothetical protein